MNTIQEYEDDIPLHVVHFLRNEKQAQALELLAKEEEKNQFEEVIPPPNYSYLR